MKATEHEPKTIHGGVGITGWIQPVCSCGWIGSKHYAHNDYQFSNSREEWQRHNISARKKDA